MNDEVKLPKWFWAVAILALIWNLIGVGAYLGEAFITDEALSALPEEQRALMESRPAWATAAFATAVWAGFVGSLLLVLRRGLAYIVLIISFIGVVIQNIHSFLIADAMKVYGSAGLIAPVLVMLIGIALILLAKKGNAAGWLR
ncbi:MAG: hypothetical protein AAF391_07545 [Bacteroidota bacterium]